MKINYANPFFGVVVFLIFQFLIIENLHAQYCTPKNIGAYNINYISNVSIGTINKSTTGSTGGYSDFTSISPTNVLIGETLTGTISITIDGWNTAKNTVAVWINFDETDDDFEDNGELFLFEARDKDNKSGNKVIEVPISISIPSNVKKGLVRMRIAMKEGAGKNFSSCDFKYNAGEVEDYNINLINESDSESVANNEESDKEPNFCSPSNIGNFNTNYIENVDFAGIENNNPGTTGSYTYYPILTEVNAIPGETINGTINVTLDGWNTNTNTVVVWMNFNENSDDDFEDNGERFLFTFKDNKNKAGTKTVEVPISIPVPNTVASGISRIRIGLRTGDATNFTACDYNYQSGEIQDYKVNLKTSSQSGSKGSSSSSSLEATTDTDGDGIFDIDDVDDDNDGILDVNECNNLLTDSGFDNKTGLNYGNNIGVNIAPWVLGSGNQANIVKVDGNGGYNYGNYGPFEDANPLTGDGQDQFYLDIASGSNDFYQAFTVTSSSKLTYGGYFSSRDGRTGSARLRIFTGSTGSSGTLIADSGTFTISPIGGNSSTTPWEFIENVVDVTAGTYSFVVSMDNDTNFDEGFAIACYDSDDDGILDYKDLDSDGDGCPDAIEGGGTFTPNDLVTNLAMDGGSTSVLDNLGLGADTNNDGLLDIAGLNGQTVGSSLDANTNNCPLVIDFDGKDDVLKTPNTFSLNNWSELTIQFWVKSNALSQSNAGIIGQKGVLEITQNGTLSCEIFGQGAEGVFTNSNWLDNADTWQHITLVYKQGIIQLYYNGKKEYEATSSAGTTLGNSTNNFNIGGLIKTGAISNYFNGWIDEVRVFNTALTESQIQQVVYQEIENNGGYVQGSVIQKEIKDLATGNKVNWNNLQLYYKMGDNFIGRKTRDFSDNALHASMQNIYAQQTETAPIPYVTKQNGNFNDTNIWLHSDVWNSVSAPDFCLESTIIKISHDVILNDNLENIGLIIDSGKTLTVGNNGSDYLIKNNWYLELNGTLNLENDSQLIQTVNSDLVTSATGKILRRQEGTSNAFRYNYWASPVGATGVTNLTNNNAVTNNTNNTAFRLNMLKDETGTNFQFTSAYNQINRISTYWLYTYKNGLTYWDWALLNPSANLTPGIGYSQKGTGNPGLQQQYIFEGKPNNGTILVNVNDKGGAGSVTSVSKTEFLLGNPYPSALDTHKFIDDNAGIIDGTLLLWQQWAGNSHYLDEYQGGYAQVNKLGSCRAFQFVGIAGANNGSQDGTITPSRYIPVGQAFMTEVIASGTVVFNNSQRVFIKEADADGTYNNGSTFLKSTTSKSKNSASTENQQVNEIQKMRLEFNSIVGPKIRREVLLGFSETTTDGYDYGYDAECDEASNNDFNLNLEGKNMNMQAYSPISNEKVVSLNFKSSGNNTFEIKATEFENIDPNQEIYLRDNSNETYFDLKQSTAYRFTSAQGKFNNRFEIVFQSKQQSLSTEETQISENFIYFQNTSNTLFGKKLNTSIDKISIVDMRGQIVQEFNNISQETMNTGLKISNVATGTYIAWFKAQTGQVITKKIIVN